MSATDANRMLRRRLQAAGADPQRTCRFGTEIGGESNACDNSGKECRSKSLPLFLRIWWS